MRQVIRAILPFGLVGWWGDAKHAVKSRRRKRELDEAVKRYIEDQPEVKKLQIGTGTSPLQDWLNTDLNPRAPGVVYLDARETLPFPDNLFDYVFSEHMIEHVPYLDGLRFLKESLRILKPGGRIRIATPDLAFLVRLYSPENSEIKQRYLSWATSQFLPHVGSPDTIFVINNFFYDFGHRFIYDSDALNSALVKAGFRESPRYEVGESDDPHLRGTETHGKVIGEEFNRLETLVCEASKRQEGIE